MQQAEIGNCAWCDEPSEVTFVGFKSRRIVEEKMLCDAHASSLIEYTDSQCKGTTSSIRQRNTSTAFDIQFLEYVPAHWGYRIHLREIDGRRRISFREGIVEGTGLYWLFRKPDRLDRSIYGVIGVIIDSLDATVTDVTVNGVSDTEPRELLADVTVKRGQVETRIAVRGIEALILAVIFDRNLSVTESILSSENLSL